MDNKTIYSGGNAAFIAELYTRYRADPASVDAGWVPLFKELDTEEGAPADPLSGASWAPSRTRVIGQGAPEAPGAAAPPTEDLRTAIREAIKARILIRSFRVRGHLLAQFDPLGLQGEGYNKDLDPATYGFGADDMSHPIFVGYVAGHDTLTLGRLLEIMKSSYCASIGVEYMHIQELDERIWMEDHMEGIDYQAGFSGDEKRRIYSQLVEADGFETFLNIKHKGTKRFGLDGGESMIPAVEAILEAAAAMGMEEVILGMPHRGRLNVLATTMDKPPMAIFSEFQGESSNPDDVQGSGDVKYHLGASADRLLGGKALHLSLTANPSHLEAVNPVVLGKVRAKQTQKGDEERTKVMGLLMHGDAAFAGQGLVPESLDLSQIRGYRTGGAVHVIVNNQIGFTTNPASSRFTPYPTDIAKGLQMPIFHVNGDDPEAVVHVARLAMEYRQAFHRDVVIDMFCYRRHGHNEGDEPMFTQPRMYKAIAEHPTTREIYERKLIAEGVLSQDEADKIKAEFHSRLEEDFAQASDYTPNKADWLEGVWEGLAQLEGEEEHHDYDTAVELGQLREVGLSLARPPAGFNVNRKILRQLKARQKMAKGGEDVDWGMAEALAYGTLLAEGTHVRLSGQDCGRGTFSHRHAVLVDQDDERRYYPLSNISPDQAQFEVMDSPLSEAGVLGFEYGFSLADPLCLVIWEAQFGDFANTAQVLIDQFISSGESKWLRMSGLVMLLPHGFEGQGPEHSSARLERYLQLCAEDNMQVVSCTTPANIFHALRRQVRRNFRKPLIVMSPKSLLRHKLVVSKLADMGPGSHFQRLIPEIDKLAAAKRVRRIVLCSGKVYFDLLDARRDQGIKDVAIVRVEQLYPLPRNGIARNINLYPEAEVVWCQEEPANMGSWTFMQPRLEQILADRGKVKGTGRTRRVFYAGRAESASPATGQASVHAAEQARLVDQALNWDQKKLRKAFQRITED